RGRRCLPGSLLILHCSLLAAFTPRHGGAAPVPSAFDNSSVRIVKEFSAPLFKLSDSASMKPAWRARCNSRGCVPRIASHTLAWQRVSIHGFVNAESRRRGGNRSYPLQRQPEVRIHSDNQWAECRELKADPINEAPCLAFARATTRQHPRF